MPTLPRPLNLFYEISVIILLIALLAFALGIYMLLVVGCGCRICGVAINSSIAGFVIFIRFTVEFFYCGYCWQG